MRPAADFAADLLALREGTLDFDRFGATHRERFRRWAAYFFERWPQRALDLEDLVQEALIEAWRSVDAYDPARGVTIDRFVEYRVGSRLRTELQRVLGWPKKSRGTKPVRPVSTSAPSVGRLVDAESALGPSAFELEVLRQVTARIADPLTREVAIGVGLGMPVRVLASYLYDDPERRILYRFDSIEHATRRVRTAARAAARHPAVVSSREDTIAGR